MKYVSELNCMKTKIIIYARGQVFKQNWDKVDRQIVVAIADKKAKLNETRRICEEIMAKGEPYRVSDLAISSRDLINMKCKAGRKVGDTLRTLLDEVMYDPSLNNRKYLLSRAKQLISK